MPASSTNRLTAARRLAVRHEVVEQEERRDAIATLLARPLLTSETTDAENFRLVRLHSEWLKKWFQRWPGWSLIVTANMARLRKHPSPRSDLTRGLVDRDDAQQRSAFTRRKYALLCLVLATLENEQRQTTIKHIASKTETAVRLDGHLAKSSFEFDTRLLAHRRELVAVMRFLQERRVLMLIDRDDLGYVQSQSDCLYRIGRSALSSMLCSARGASMIPQTEVDELIEQLNFTEIPETPQAQNEELQHCLVRRLLDDPVMYFDELTAREYEYFYMQGERILKELRSATGMEVERRAEGVALLTPVAIWTDLGLPESGTRGHATLLLAEWFGSRLRACTEIECRIDHDEVFRYVQELAKEYQPRWRKDAGTKEGVRQICRDAVDILQSLSLIDVRSNWVIPRPAVARYRLGELERAISNNVRGDDRRLFE